MRTTALVIALLLATVATATSSCGDETCASAQNVPEDIMELMQTHGGALVRKHSLTQMTVNEHNVDSLLDYIKTTIRKGNLPPADQSKVRSIKELIENSLLDSLTKVHDDGAGEVETLVANFAVCNTNDAKRQKEDVDRVGDNTTSSRGEHAECRSNEIAALARKEEAHNELKNLIEVLPTLNPTPTLSPEVADGNRLLSEADITTFRNYVADVETKQCRTHQAKNFNEKDATYTNETKVHESIQGTCNHLQRQFEGNFCGWRLELINACQALGTCNVGATEAYKARKDSLSSLVQAWKTEYTGLQKILCYIDIWMSDNNTETVDKNQVDRCDNVTVNTSSMELTFPDAPESLGCDTVPVSIYPCKAGDANCDDGSWKKQEYSSIPNAAECDISCTFKNETGTTAATTTAPTTAATTTTPATAATTTTTTNPDDPYPRGRRDICNGGGGFYQPGTTQTREACPAPPNGDAGYAMMGDYATNTCPPGTSAFSSLAACKAEFGEGQTSPYNANQKGHLFGGAVGCYYEVTQGAVGFNSPNEFPKPGKTPLKYHAPICSAAR